MSIASRIQEIETHIGDIYDTINYSYDTTGVNKNIINIPKYLKKGYIDIINNGIDTLYNNFPKVSGIGSNLSLTPTYEAPMKLNEIQGDTLQDGTPTPDTPVPIQSVTGLQNIEVCGKNLITTYNYASSGYINYNYDNSKIGKTMTYSFIPNFSTTNATLYIRANTSISSYNVGTIATITSGTKVSVTFTLTDEQYNTIKNTTGGYIQVYKSGVSMNENSISNPMLEINNQATEYEPYKGTTYEVNLGKNIWSVGNKNVSWATNYLDVKNILNTLSEGTYSITLNFKVTEIVKEKTNNYYGFTFHNSNGHIYNKKNTNSNINVDDNFVYTYTFTISSSQVGNFTNAYFYGFGNDTDDVTARSLMYDCQLEKGQATSYSPYFTPIELNKIGDYQDSIKKSTGKNLFDINGTITQGTLDKYNNGFTLIKGTNRRIRFVLPEVLPAGTYTLSYDVINSVHSATGNYFYISCQYGNNNTSVLNDVIINDSGATFTTTSEFDRLYIFIAGNQDDTATITIDNVQLEQNNQATTYEPYGKVWYVEKQIGKVVLDGSNSENWTQNSSQTLTNTNYFASNIIDNTLKSGEKNSFSNYFTVVNELWNTDIQGIQFSTSSSNIRLRINKTTATDTATFKTWLSTHNTEVLYVLATPEYTEITNTELIEDLETLYTAKSQEGTTNISITSEDLEMILNISALEGEA
jgi:hypothetical protein